jgi:hypothetical protein
MEAFGVRFEVTDRERFASLQALFREIKRDKDAETFRDAQSWVAWVPDYAKAQFDWPDDQEREKWAAKRAETPIRIAPPEDQIGSRWVFDRVFESVEESEYTLLTCEMVDATHAEIQIDPWSYPYGGVGPFVALVEAFGFRVAGVNVYGRYQSREALLGAGSD